MQVILPDNETGVAYAIRRDQPMDDDEYYAFCMENSNLRIEREANGEIIITPPTGGETGLRNSDLNFQLTDWSYRDGRGSAFDSNTEFFLSDGAALAPDASWVLKSRISRLTKEERRRFLPLCPDFVVELTSPGDRLSKVMAKMQQWIANGAALGWLIDADRRTVYVYRPDQEHDKLIDTGHVDGEGPVKGFRLNLARIWQGL